MREEPATGHHLRPIRADDTEKDTLAVMGWRQRLRSAYGEAWAPPGDMTAEQDCADLQHHADEIERQESYNQALFGREETGLIDCAMVTGRAEVRPCCPPAARANPGQRDVRDPARDAEPAA